MGNEKSEPKESKYPKLETRRNREVSHGEEPERAEKERRHANANTAFYVIEREAIRLRRLRWDLSTNARTASARIDEAATRAASRTNEARAGQPPSEPLAHYAREKDQPAPRTDERFVSRLQNRISGMFGKSKE